MAKTTDQPLQSGPTADSANKTASATQEGAVARNNGKYGSLRRGFLRSLSVPTGKAAASQAQSKEPAAESLDSTVKPPELSATAATKAQKAQRTPEGGASVLAADEMEFFQSRLQAIRRSLQANIVGQEELLQHLMLALIGGGHILVEGVPGLAKTLAVRSLAASLQLGCKRIQFTPDLLPADLIGTMIFHQSKDEFIPRHGPIFTQVLLADEINRAPAKVQSALLEAMAEQQVTIGDHSYPLPQPFFVMATQNPIEEEGTYPLPAAQLDRFDLKYVVRYPSPKDELQLLLQYQQKALGFQKVQAAPAAAPPDSKLGPAQGAAPNHPVQNLGTNFALQPQDLFRLRQIAAKIRLGEPLARYIVNIVNATREASSRLEFSRYLDLGASPRASLALCRYAGLYAIFAGRDYVLPNDIKMVCPAVLRHRLLLSYEAEAENQSADDVIQQILRTVAVP